jgi:hypothetical protein
MEGAVKVFSTAFVQVCGLKEADELLVNILILSWRWLRLWRF